MKTKFKLSNRILSLVLALVMVLVMLPTISFTASAATTKRTTKLSLSVTSGNSQNEAEGWSWVKGEDAWTLTLNNANIEVADDVAVYLDTSTNQEPRNINIVLNGDNRIVSTKSSAQGDISSLGIKIENFKAGIPDVTFSGDGALLVKGQSSGIYSANNIIFDNANVTVEGGYYGGINLVGSDGNSLTIKNNSVVNVNHSTSDGNAYGNTIHSSYGDITVENSTLNVSAASNGSELTLVKAAKTISVSNSTLALNVTGTGTTWRWGVGAPKISISDSTVNATNIFNLASMVVGSASNNAVTMTNVSGTFLNTVSVASSSATVANCNIYHCSRSGNVTVYGNATLPDSVSEITGTLSFKNSTDSLTIPAGKSLTFSGTPKAGAGTVINNGNLIIYSLNTFSDSSCTLSGTGDFLLMTEATSDCIVVPDDLIYTGSVLLTEDTDRVYLQNPQGTVTILKTAFKQQLLDKANWVLSFDRTVLSVGEYTATFTNNGKTVSKTFSVSKASASVSTPTAQNSITYGVKLNEVGLPSGWIWANGDTVPVVENNGYVAYYTPADTDNYDWTTVDGWNATEKRVERTVSVIVNKSDINLDKSPEAKTDLVYNGSEQELISAGSVTNGTMQYALGTAEAVTGEWKTELPKSTQAGTYYVWYKAVGNENYNDVDPVCITVKIDKVKLTISQTYTELNWYPGMGISYYSIKPYFSVTTADGTAFRYKDFTMYDSKGGEVEKLENADTYSFKFSLYNSDADNYEFENDTVTIKFNPFDLSTITEKPSMTALSPTYTGQKIFPQQTASGKLNFRIYILNPLRDAEKTTMYSLDYFDGYWEFEEISGKNCTEAGDAYVNIVGKGGNVVGSYEYEYSIKQKEMDAPVGLQAVDETISKKKDGKINGLTTAMEYSTSKYGTYKPVTDVNMLFEADTYYVRTAAPNSNYEPSDPVEITIGEGRKLTVTIPTAEEQIGYTLTVDKNALDWHGQVMITFALADGYSKSETDFAVKVNDTAITLNENDKYLVTGAETDLTITVAGVVDETAPEVEISISTNKWTEFLKDITFGLFFKETQDVTITATDKGSGVKKIEYYLAHHELGSDELEAIANWTEYNGTFKINPDNQYVIYVKVADNSGNTVYLNSDGIVLDATAPSVYGIENGGVYYGDKIFKAMDDNFLKIEVDSVDITDTTEGDDEFKIVADNDEHTVTVTDKAGNVTEYKITVYKNYTVTFKVVGVTVDTQTVGYGKDATAPTIPTKEGYTQTAPTWDKDGKNITADTEINAVYTINKYTVTYKADGEVVDAVTVEHGKDATAPAIPEKEGYTQTAPTWDKDGKEITEDTTITAVYTVNEYTVTFMDENGVYKTVTVKHGEKVTMPEAPTKDGYTVTWEKEIDTVTADANVKAVYTKIPVADTNSPQTGDNSNLWLWVALLFISGGATVTLTVVDRKKRAAQK